MVNKQEEMLKWAEGFLRGVAHNGYCKDLNLTMLEELRDFGVVIKVDRELPDITPCSDEHCQSYCHYEERNNLIQAGYVTVEPLIKE